MEPNTHEGAALWQLLKDYKVNKRKLAQSVFKKSDSILAKWKDQEFVDVEKLQMIRGYFKYHYGYDIRERFPKLPETLPDIAVVTGEKATIYGDPEKVLILKNKEIEQLEIKNLDLTTKLNDLYDKVFSGYFEKVVVQFDTQNKLMKELIDTRVK